MAGVDPAIANPEPIPNVAIQVSNHPIEMAEAGARPLTGLAACGSDYVNSEGGC